MVPYGCHACLARVVKSCRLPRCQSTLSGENPGTKADRWRSSCSDMWIPRAKKRRRVGILPCRRPGLSPESHEACGGALAPMTVAVTRTPVPGLVAKELRSGIPTPVLPGPDSLHIEALRQETPGLGLGQLVRSQDHVRFMRSHLGRIQSPGSSPTSPSRPGRIRSNTRFAGLIG